MDDTILKVKDLKKSYGKKVAVQKIDFEIKKNDIVGFIGPNGSGKTTTLNCIMNIVFKDNGEIYFKNKKITSKSYKYKFDIGYLIEENNIFYKGKIKEIFNFTLGMYKKYKKIDDEFTQNLINVFKIDVNEKFSKLSSGNKRKVLLVNELIKNPDFLILDEPTNGLDVLNRELFVNVIKEFNKKGKTILLSSHNLIDIENLCRKIVIIKNGKIVLKTDVYKLKHLFFDIVKYIYLKKVIEQKGKDSIDYGSSNFIEFFKIDENNIDFIKKLYNEVSLKLYKNTIEKCKRFIQKYENFSINAEDINMAEFQFIFEVLYL